MRRTAMTDLAAMLGEIDDCLEDYLGDDAAPSQLEADAQNRKILRRRKKLEKLLRKNPELAEELGKFTIGGAFKSLGKGITAPMRIVGKVATGDFKGALSAAADPLGMRKLLRKGTHTVQDVQRVLGAPQKALASAGARLAGNAGLGLGFRLPMPTPSLQMKCTPCSTAVPDAIVKKVVPEMQRVQKLLNTMELSRKATSEHKRKRQQEKWRKEVITLLKRIQEKRCA
jgi:hypothetical protein